MRKLCALSLLVLVFCFAMSAAAEEKKPLDPLKLILFAQGDLETKILKIAKN